MCWDSHILTIAIYLTPSSSSSSCVRVVISILELVSTNTSHRSIMPPPRGVDQEMARPMKYGDGRVVVEEEGRALASAKEEGAVGFHLTVNAIEWKFIPQVHKKITKKITKHKLPYVKEEFQNPCIYMG